MIIIGSTCLQQSDGPSLFSTASTIANVLARPEVKEWRVLNVLHRVASQVGALDVGYKGGIKNLNNIKFLYLLGAVSQ